MAVGNSSLASLDEIWGPRRPRKQGTVVGTTVAIALHVLVGAALLRVDAAALLRGDQTVEMEVHEPPPPPPPEVKPEEPPPPPPPVAKPHVVVRHVATPTPPTEAPPPPSEAPPPKAAAAPPVFGVSLDSTVAGDGPGVSVPVGNTLNTKPSNKATGPVQPLTGSPTGDPDALSAPVPEYLIAEDVRVLQEVTAPFPPEAQRMGIEGKVKLRVIVGPTGEVLKVTVLEKAGHGFDDLARDALKKFKFSPARTQDGKAVTRAIVYTYKFEQAQ